MVGIYFSGTGNTKFCVEEYVNFSVSNGRLFSIEDPNVKKAFDSESGECIVLGFPSHDGDMPIIMRKFIEDHKEDFSGREVMVIITMAKVNGDAGGRALKLLKECRANVKGTVHVKMPDVRTDVEKRFTSSYENKKTVEDAKAFIHSVIIDQSRGKWSKDGQSLGDKIAGKLNKGITRESVIKVTIDTKKCNKCRECIEMCPTKVFKMEGPKILIGEGCTMCYRCVNRCKKKAITILGKEVDEQTYIEKYADNKEE